MASQNNLKKKKEGTKSENLKVDFSVICLYARLFLQSISFLFVTCITSPKTKLVSNVRHSWIILLVLLLFIPQVSSGMCLLNGGIFVHKYIHKYTDAHLKIFTLTPVNI